MTNEQKQLLLKDLYGRLPYKTKVFFSIVYDEPVELSLTILRCLERIPLGQNDIVIKPYLRPMSSMTEEEINEYENFIANEKDDLIRFCNELVFYNTHHLDYRGLIKMGLAIDCTNLNIY